MIEAGAPANPIAAVTHPNPYPFYDELVRHRPLYYDEQLAAWVVSSADAVSAVLTNDAFRVRPSDEPIPQALRHSAAGDLFGRFIRMADGADRDRLKSVVAARIDTLDVERVARVTEACSASLFAGLGRPPDWNRFTSDFALPLPSHVVTNLLDIQDSAAPEICRWLDDLVRCFSPAATPLEVERGKIAAEQLLSALNATKGFVTDLTGDVCRAGFEGPYLAVANALGLLFQSYEGIAGLIGNAVIELSYRAQSAQKTHDDGRVLQSVVEHVVRNDSPVQNTRRFVAERVYALGKTFAQGDRVLLILAAANRDPKANGRVFTFGAGVHACPGGMIAMTIATKALECIVAQHTDLAPIAGTVSYRPSQNTRVPLFGLDTIR